VRHQYFEDMEEYIESTRRGKIRFYSALLFIALCLVGMDMYGRYIESSYFDSALTAEELVAESKQHAEMALIVIVLIQPVFWLVAYTLFRFGRRIKESGRYPPPGSDMPFRMKILKGTKASRQALACDISAALMILFGLGNIYFVLRIFQMTEELLAGV